MPSSPPSIPLTGADCFLRAFDHEVRRNAGASHVSQLVLRLGPGFDPAVLEKWIAEVVPANPILRAPIGRRYGVLEPRYFTGRSNAAPLPPVRVIDTELPEGVDPEALGCGDVALPARFFAAMNEIFEPSRGELLRFDVVRYGGGALGSDLAISWLHMLLDGSGSEGFVRWLDECFRGVSRADDPPGGGVGEALSELPPDVPRSEHGDRARAWKSAMDKLGEEPVHSLAGPLARTQQSLRYRITTFDSAQTQTITQRAAASAGFLTPMLFYLAASIRAHLALFRGRGVDPGHIVVPLPVNLRPKGSEGAIFRTHVSLFWFHATPEECVDMRVLIEVLKAQRRHAISGHFSENGIIAMDYARYAPRGMYARMARRSFGGELGSFFFAYTGEFIPGLETFMGAPVRNGFHAPPVPPSPGSSIAFSLREGRLNATHVSQEGVLRLGEAEIFEASLRRDLLGED